MLNRIRVVTMLMMVLVIFALLQLISGGLFFSSLKQNQDSFAASNDLRLQQSELTSTWDLMLQTRINLSRSSARMMMDPNNQQTRRMARLCGPDKARLSPHWRRRSGTHKPSCHAAPARLLSHRKRREKASGTPVFQPAPHLAAFTNL